MDRLELDATALARIIREQSALPITEVEAERLAGALEASKDDDEFLANALSTVRFLVDEIGRSLSDGLP